MTEQQTAHIPAHARSLILAAAQEASAVITWTDNEKRLSGLYTKHQKDASEELIGIAKEIDELRAKYATRHAELEEQGKHIAAELADAGRRKDQHAEDAQDARQTLLDWCARRGIDPATLPTVTANGTGPLPAVTSGGHAVLTAEQVRAMQGLPRKGEQRPALAEGDTTTTRADTQLPVPPGGDPAADGAGFHRGNPDAHEGQRDA